MDVAYDFSSDEVCVGTDDLATTDRIRGYEILQRILLRLGSKADFWVPIGVRTAELTRPTGYVNSGMLREIEMRCYAALKPVFGRNVTISAEDLGKGTVGLTINANGFRVVAQIDLTTGSTRINFDDSTLDFSGATR
jgi:hypothetical protein